jgi:glutamate-1-semialdehyde aminotransferase
MTVASSKACLEILDAEEIGRLNIKGDLLADGLQNILKDLGIRGQVLGYGGVQSLHLTTEEQVLDPVSYLINNHMSGFSETMALFRRSLINKGVMTLENMMALRTSVPLTEDEIKMALGAMKETFTEIHPILKEVSPHLIAN